MLVISAFPVLFLNQSDLWFISFQSVRELIFGFIKFFYCIFALYFTNVLVLSLLSPFISFFWLNLLVFSNFLIRIFRVLIFSLFFFFYMHLLLYMSLIKTLAVSQVLIYILLIIQLKIFFKFSLWLLTQ